MRPPLAIAVAQPPTTPHDLERNAAAHADTIRAAGSRVVVFPELSLTGYELDAAPVDPGDPRLGPIIAACGETGSIALVGAPVAGVHGSVHIGVLAVDGGGARVAYRKMWLGSAEAERFAPGHEPVVLDVDGWQLGLAVCRDTGIEQHAADTARRGMDVYVAGVLEHREDAAVPDERARRVAAAHGVWVATASYAGAAGGGFDRAAGGSGIWSPRGEPISRAGEATGEIARATLEAPPRL